MLVVDESRRQPGLGVGGDGRWYVGAGGDVPVRVVERVEADRLAGLKAEPAAGVVRHAPDDVVAGCVVGQCGLHQPGHVAGRDPGGQGPAAGVDVRAGRAEAGRHDRQAEPVGVQAAEGLERDLA
ncbi:MAG: hypothetical protein ACRDPR_21895, partial [Nocardioidaceae bacterium]